MACQSSSFQVASFLLFQTRFNTVATSCGCLLMASFRGESSTRGVRCFFSCSFLAEVGWIWRWSQIFEQHLHSSNQPQPDFFEKINEKKPMQTERKLILFAVFGVNRKRWVQVSSVERERERVLGLTLHDMGS